MRGGVGRDFVASILAGGVVSLRWLMYGMKAFGACFGTTEYRGNAYTSEMSSASPPRMSVSSHRACSRFALTMLHISTAIATTTATRMMTSRRSTAVLTIEMTISLDDDEPPALG